MAIAPPAPLKFRDDSVESMGAVPYTCDFQVHAPPDWAGGIGSKSVEDFIKEEFLPNIAKSGRQVIGIPQHGPMIQQNAKLVRDLARKMRAANLDAPVVFPGYELTSSDQIQVILLANPDTDNLKELDTRVHERLQLGKGKWHESALNISDLLFQTNDRFRDDLLSLVVATGHKGILESKDAATRNRASFQKAVAHADGFIIAKAFSAESPFVQSVLNGELQDYCENRVPVVQSSDADSFAGITNGAFSYVKLGSFSVEGLRQALLNCATYISEKPFGFPNYAIEAVKINKTVFFDKLDLRFSKHLTTLVGGRGTGKSSILEYIAHVCDYQRSNEYDRPNAKILLQRQTSSDEGTVFPTTDIELNVRLGEKHYRVQRRGTASTEIYECEDGSCTGGVLQSNASASSLLNLRFFGQRELANIVRNDSFFTLDPSQRAGINLFSFLRSEHLSLVDSVAALR